jgi:hypothetical protein
MGWPIPNIVAMIQRIGAKKAKYYSLVDLTKGYHQMSLSKESRKYTAFRTQDGLYQWIRVAMGLKGAGAFFQEAMSNTVLSNLIYNTCEVYIDDVLQFGEDEKSYLKNLRDLLERFRQYNILLNPNKCKFGLSEVEFVGHLIDHQGITFSKKKIEKALSFALPTKMKEMKSFLGFANYFRQHIRDYANISYPLSEMTAKYVPKKPLSWNEETKKAFYDLVNAISECPKLYFVDENAPITVMTDASKYGIGGYVFQTIREVEVPIAFVSKALNITEKNWTIEEKEAYAIFYTLKKLEYLLKGVKFTP